MPDLKSISISIKSLLGKDMENEIYQVSLMQVEFNLETNRNDEMTMYSIVRPAQGKVLSQNFVSEM